MSALAHETLEAVMPKVATPPSDLDDVLWQAWKAMELPEGYHAEIDPAATASPATGRAGGASTPARRFPCTS